MRIRGFKSNIAANAVGVLIPLIVTFVTVPIYLRYVGDIRYGVILIAWSLLGYLGFMDFGLSRATNHALAKLQVNTDGKKKGGDRYRIFWSSILVNLLFGAIGAILAFFVFTGVLGHFIQIPDYLDGEVSRAVPYLALMLPVAILSGVGVGACESQERFVTLNVIQGAGFVLGQLVPLAIAVLITNSLDVILFSMLLVRAVTAISILIYAIQILHISFRPIFDVDVVKKLLSFGGWVTVTNLISPIMTMFDQIVIGRILGVAVVPYYSIPMTIVQRTLLVPTIVIRTVFPYFSRVDGAEQARAVALLLIRLSALSTFVYVTAIFCGDDFLRWWVGAEMANKGTVVLRFIAFGAWWNSLAFVVFSALQARARPRAVALLHSIEVLPYLGLLFLMTIRFGIVGAAVAWTIRVIFDAGVLLYLYGVQSRALFIVCVSSFFPALALLFSFLLPMDFTGSILASLLFSGTNLMTAVALDKDFRLSVLKAVKRLK